MSAKLVLRAVCAAVVGTLLLASMSPSAQGASGNDPEDYDPARVELADFLVPLQDDMRRLYQDQFGGLWIAEDGRVHVATAGTASSIQERVKQANIPAEVIFHSVQFSESSLIASMEKVEEAVRDAKSIDLGGVDVTMIALSIPDNAIVFTHQGIDDEQKAILTNLVGPVIFKEAKEDGEIQFVCSSRDNCGSPARAGLQLWRDNGTTSYREKACASAFVIKNGATPPRYMLTTAGHCYTTSGYNRYHPESLYLGSTLAGRVYMNGVDAMAFTIPTSQASNRLYIHPTFSRNVTATSYVSQEVIGMYVCSSKISGNSCGYLTNTNGCADSICGLRVASNIRACGGDSGSPIYVPLSGDGARALGILAASLPGSQVDCPGTAPNTSPDSMYSHISISLAELAGESTYYVNLSMP